MRDEQYFLTEEEATRLWQRAAQLQAEEARKAEAQAVSEAEGELFTGADFGSDGYALSHVRAAALEAGMGEEFVEAALAEVRSERAVERASKSRGGRFVRWLLGRPEDTLTVRRIIHASPAAILPVMEAVFPNEPYKLRLRNQVGDPWKGGTLIFDIKGASFAVIHTSGFRKKVSQADVRQVFAALTPLPGETSRTEVAFRSPVAWAYPINAAVTAVMSVVGGVAGLFLTAIALFGSGVPPDSGFALLILLVILAGGWGGMAFGVSAHRAFYRHARRRGAKALDELLATVATKVEGVWGLASGDPERR